MAWWDNLVECVITKINGTPVECAINEEVAIAKAEVKLAALAVDIQEETSKITDNAVKATYTSAVARIRAKQQS